MQNLSATHHGAAWGFAYTDANVTVSLCFGYADTVSKTPCTVEDQYAWGSTTKSQTAVLLLRLVSASLDLRMPVLRLYYLPVCAIWLAYKLRLRAAPV